MKYKKLRELNPKSAGFCAGAVQLRAMIAFALCLVLLNCFWAALWASILRAGAPQTSRHLLEAGREPAQLRGLWYITPLSPLGSRHSLLVVCSVCPGLLWSLSGGVYLKCVRSMPGGTCETSAGDVMETHTARLIWGWCSCTENQRDHVHKAVPFRRRGGGY